MLKYFLIASLSLFTTMAVAATELENIRGLLDDGDVAGLEAKFTQLHKSALGPSDFNEIRWVISKSMATTHEGRISTIIAWNVDYPQSPYAKVAAAQMHKHIAFLYRGTQSSMRTSGQALEKFREEIKMVISMAEEAFSLAPDYLPASDLVFSTSVGGRTNLEVNDIVRHVFSNSPNLKTLKNALYALQPAWGGSSQKMFELCAEFADQIPSYDADLCIVEAILENDLHLDARKIALEIAELRQDELSDKALLVVLIEPEFPVSDAAAKKAVELHKKSLGRFNSLYAYRLKTAPLQRKYNWPGYRKQAFDYFIEYVEQALVDDPYNNWLLSPLVHSPLSSSYFRAQENPPSEAEILERRWQLWAKMHRYGQYRPSTWQTGAQIAISGVKSGQKSFVAFPYYSTAISLSPKPQNLVGSLLELLHNDYNSAQRNIANANGFLNPDLPPPEAVLEYTTCEYVRAARLLQAFCSNTYETEDACRYTGADRYAEAALELENLDAICPSVVHAPLIDLMYKPIPPDQFGDWDIANAPGN